MQFYDQIEPGWLLQKLTDLISKKTTYKHALTNVPLITGRVRPKIDPKTFRKAVLFHVARGEQSFLRLLNQQPAVDPLHILRAREQFERLINTRDNTLQAAGDSQRQSTSGDTPAHAVGDESQSSSSQSFSDNNDESSEKISYSTSQSDVEPLPSIEEPSFKDFHIKTGLPPKEITTTLIEVVSNLLEPYINPLANRKHATLGIIGTYETIHNDLLYARRHYQRFKLMKQGNLQITQTDDWLHNIPRAIDLNHIDKSIPTESRK